jgi:hypothetical protein
MFMSMACSDIYIYIYILEVSCFGSILQDQIEVVIVEGVENVGGEDWIEIKTEEDCIQLVGGVKCEQEVSVLCCVFGVQVCVCVCVLYCTLCSVTHSFHTCISHHFSFCLSSSRCTCVGRSV